ncbi:MAG: hypothetical protein JWO10_661 [Microbacteriaceae bacterium]|nr:hypothetical protein [Microbacteriaceae bacterium]
MSPFTQPAKPTQRAASAFTRKRVVRAAGVASAGLLAGLSIFAATPAFAATDDQCTTENTVDATAGGTPQQIQDLLDLSTPLICLSGTFDLTDSLVYNYSPTLHGLSNAVLNASVPGNSVTILSDFAFANNTTTIENLRLTGAGNSAISDSNVVVRNSTFDNNRGYRGGAIAAYTVDISGSTFEDNTAFGDLGGAIYAGVSAVVNASTFHNNVAAVQGGAISVNSGGTATITNSTFVANEAEEGGGALFGALTTLLHSTFLNNISTSPAGQSIMKEDSAATNLRGNIFAGTTAAGTSQLGVLDPAYNFNDGGGNIFSTALADESVIVDPQASTGFGITPAALFNGAVLADNGASTQTVALWYGSPALDFVPVGSPSVDIDERGVARVGLSDAGAYEFTGSAPVPDPTPAPALAATGGTAPSGLWGAAGGLLIAAGAFAMFMTRRVRRAL